MNYETAEKIVIRHFEQFYGADVVTSRARERYVNLATQMTVQAFSWKECYSATDVEDFVHGLTHIFFDGIIEGKTNTKLGKD